MLLLRLCQLILLGMVVAAVLGVGLYRLYSHDLPDPAQLTTHRPFETTRIYARDGQTLLYEVFGDGHRTMVPLSDIPLTLQQAVIAAEDVNFYTHSGVDLRAIVRSAWLNSDGEIRSGASTITQQLARTILLSADERTQLTLDRKAREAILAFEINRRFSKEQILNFYLNEIYYGNQAYGIEAAAQNYLGKPARDLSLAEAALLAGLIQAPTDLNPLQAPVAARDRRIVVLDLMMKQGFITPDQAATAANEPINVRPSQTDLRYPHWVFYIRTLLEQRYGADAVQRGGLQVTTSLDPAMQQIAEQVVAQQLANLRPLNASNASVVVLDPRTNQVLAMVGSANYNDPAIDGQFNVALAERQPGSTLKPIVYAAAMQRGWTPATIIWDTPTNFDGYQPRNFDRQFHGPQSLRAALGMSLNIPAVKTLQFVGLPSFIELGQAMGLTTLDDRPHGLPLALGSGETRLIDLANVYSTLANAGHARPLEPILNITSSRGEVIYRAEPTPGTQVLGPHGEAISYLITDMLSDNAARTPSFGANSLLRLANDRPAAVKTGTTDDFRDSLAVGYTPSLVVGAWVGNSDNSPMQRVAGATGAGAIWHDIMEAAHAGQPHQAFARPNTVIDAQVCAGDGTAAAGCAGAYTERFVTGQLPPSRERVAPSNATSP